eukprot:ANDGO_01439.mRNA.1 hypothetical protein
MELPALAPYEERIVQSHLGAGFFSFFAVVFKERSVLVPDKAQHRRGGGGGGGLASDHASSSSSSSSSRPSVLLPNFGLYERAVPSLRGIKRLLNFRAYELLLLDVLLTPSELIFKELDGDLETALDPFSKSKLRKRRSSSRSFFCFKRRSAGSSKGGDGAQDDDDAEEEEEKEMTGETELERLQREQFELENETGNSPRSHSANVGRPFETKQGPVLRRVGKVVARVPLTAHVEVFTDEQLGIVHIWMHPDDLPIRLVCDSPRILSCVIKAFIVYHISQPMSSLEQYWIRQHEELAQSHQSEMSKSEMSSIALQSQGAFGQPTNRNSRSTNDTISTNVNNNSSSSSSDNNNNNSHNDASSIRMTNEPCQSQSQSQSQLLSVEVDQPTQRFENSEPRNAPGTPHELDRVHASESPAAPRLLSLNDLASPGPLRSRPEETAQDLKPSSRPVRVEDPVNDDQDVIFTRTSPPGPLHHAAASESTPSSFSASSNPLSAPPFAPTPAQKVRIESHRSSAGSEVMNPPFALSIASVRSGVRKGPMTIATPSASGSTGYKNGVQEGWSPPVTSGRKVAVTPQQQRPLLISDFIHDVMSRRSGMGDANEFHLPPQLAPSIDYVLPRPPSRSASRL